MELNDFVAKFAELFEEIDTHDFNGQTNFRDNDEWSSLVGLSVIAMVDEEYDVILKGDDVKRSKTIEDVYNVVKSKL